MCDDDRQLSPEHVRRLVRNTLYGYNERCLQMGSAFELLSVTGDPIRTLWRATANWSQVGPMHLYVPDALAATTIANAGRPTVRVLVNFRTTGSGLVGLWAINMGVGALVESQMDTVFATGPVSAGPYAIVESGDTTEFSVALRLPVHAGWNTWFIALKCEPDGDDTPAVVSGSYRQWMVSTRRNEVRHPSVSSDAGSTSTYAPFQYVEVAESSTEHTAGNFSRYTVSGIRGGWSSLTDNNALLCYEATDEEFDNARGSNTFDPGFEQAPEVYAVTGDLCRCYIDGISIDGSSTYTLEDRQFGSAHRYLQLVSGAQTGLPLREALALHESRLPQAGVVQDLQYELALTDSSSRGVPGLWRQETLTSSYQTVGSDNLGVYDAATPVPETLPGYQLQVEIRLAFCLSDTVQATTDRFAPYIECRAFVTDPSTVSTFGDAVVARGLIVPTGLRLSRHLLWSATRDASFGCAYGCEGMTLRTDLSLWQTVTCVVTPPAGFDTDLFRLAAVQVRATASTDGGGVSPPGRYVTVSPLGIRFKQVPL